MAPNPYHPVRIVFWGTPSFSVLALEKLLSKRCNVAAIVTNPDAVTGRKKITAPPPVKTVAVKHGIPVLQPDTLKDEVFAASLKGYNPDIFIVAAYGKIIPLPILSLARHGALNIHPSLLPKWRGPSPVESAILAGEKETGVTIMQMDEKMDHGPIILQKEVRIGEDETRITLYEKLFSLGAELLVKIMPRWIEGKITPIAQDHTGATYSKILTREDGKLFWDNPAKVLERQVRAYAGWPGAYCLWQRTREVPARLKIEAARAIPDKPFPKPYGMIWQTAKIPLAIQTLDGSLEILSLQLEGGKSLDASEFVKGHPDIIGTILL